MIRDISGISFFSYRHSVPGELRNAYESELARKYEQYFKIVYVLSLFGNFLFIPTDIYILKIPFFYSVLFRVAVYFPINLILILECETKISSAFQFLTFPAFHVV